MNTIVFVLVVATYGGYRLPTTEFTTLEKCEAGKAAYQAVVGGNSLIKSGLRGVCVKIEK
jgi:hypothetical protein